MKLKVKDICTIAILIALGIVLSQFLFQIRLFSDLRIDLSYTVIVFICHKYGGVVGGLSAGLMAGLNSLLFSFWGFSIAWTLANIFIGLVTGFVLNHCNFKNKALKTIIDLTAIILSCAIGMLFIKTIIECELFAIPFAVKIAKNSVAFALDAVVMCIGYVVLLPKIYKSLGKKNYKNEKETNIKRILG